MLDGKSLFITALYHVDGRFSHLPQFLSLFPNDFDDLPFDTVALSTSIRAVRKKFESKIKNKKLNSSNIVFLLAIEELDKVLLVLEDEEFISSIPNADNLKGELLQACLKGIEHLRQIGISADMPELFFVDEFPAPYNNRQSGIRALAIDEGDRAQFNINPGIYFLNSGLRPFYSQALLLHELIHIVLGKRSPLLLARGLEEGLAEVLGSIFLSSKCIGKELTQNIFIYNRLSFGFNQFWETYLDYTRQATFLLNLFGLKGLGDLLNGGRELVKKIEVECLKGNLSAITLTKGAFDKDTIEIANYVSSTYGRNLVLSPLGYYINRFIKQGLTTFEIFQSANVEREDGLIAINEISERIFLAHFRDDNSVCTFSDSPIIAPFVRYSIK